MIRTRTFHAVGQGAFYSEKHDGFSIVYDCGTSSKKDYLSQEILSLDKDEKVILFISHFDKDHISGIKELKDHVNITHVIMPLLYDEDKALIIAYYKAGGEKIEILENPKAYWGEKTKILYIKPADSENTPEESVNIDFSKNERDNSKNIEASIPSGTLLTTQNKNWVFIPYNYDSEARHQQIINMLKNLQICIKKFISSPNYALRKLKNNIISIKNAYKEANGIQKHGKTSLINENSMFLYSGPIIEPFKYWCKILEKKGNVIFYGIHRGCIYTGDGDLNLVDLDAVYSKFIYNVGSVQIPHHGSLKNFKVDFFIDKGYVCLVSVGQNRKNFPAATVIKDLVNAKCFPHIVTEKTNNLINYYYDCSDIKLEKPICVYP